MTTYRSDLDTVQDDGDAPDELQQLLEAAGRDSRLENAFFAALLDATVYVLRPIADDHPRPRLLVFTRPDGMQFLPGFTTLSRARVAAAGGYEPMALRGRDLLSAIPELPCVIDPNDGHCTLYPEEIASLLGGAPLPVLNSEQASGKQVIAHRPTNLPEWLAPATVATLSRINGVAAAFVTEITAPDEKYLLVMIDAAPAARERASRALIAVLQPLCHGDGIELIISEALQFKDAAVQLLPHGVGRDTG